MTPDETPRATLAEDERAEIAATCDWGEVDFDLVERIIAAHVAEQLAPLVEARRAEERERIATAILRRWSNGTDPRDGTIPGAYNAGLVDAADVARGGVEVHLADEHAGERVCAELWHYDETWAVCHRTEDHDGHHLSITAGDNGTRATITWERA